MTVREIREALDLNAVSPGDGTREVTGVIIGDLLSHVLGEAREGWLWVTIQVHLNVAAVAVLKDLPLIVLASDRKPQDDLAEKCREEGLTLATTPLTSYEIACRLCRLGVGHA
jgi:hypothetical protein